MGQAVHKRALEPEEWPEWMKTTTAMSYLDCSRNTLKGLAAAGKVIRSDFSGGGRPDWRYQKSSIDRFLLSRTEQTARQKALALMKGLRPR